MNLSVGNYFPQSQPFPKHVKSPEARFTDHHRQAFSFLAPTLNNKVIQFSSYISLQLQIPHTSTPS